MKTPKILYGKCVKKWVVVADAKKLNGKRRLVVKCLACGQTKTTGTDAILNNTLQDCDCKMKIPADLPKYMGFACDSRVCTAKCTTGLNRHGYCCYYCPEKESCKEVCLNTPDHCGCFQENSSRLRKHDEITPDKKAESPLHYAKEAKK